MIKSLTGFLEWLVGSLGKEMMGGVVSQWLLYSVLLPLTNAELYGCGSKDCGICLPTVGIEFPAKAVLFQFVFMQFIVRHTLYITSISNLEDFIFRRVNYTILI